MELIDILNRTPQPAPWTEGDKIPWDEPGFSRRMLREHLSQAHDAASRRFEIIDRHCAWIHTAILGGRPARVLDLACGPGLYAQRLARLGHAVTGLDFSPASIQYAREQVENESLDCRFELADLRAAEFGGGFDLAMLIYGEFNVFRPAQARRILEKAHAALVPGGRLLLEVHTFEAVRAEGLKPRSWYGAQSGLFSDEPFLCLSESFWDGDAAVAMNRFYVIDAATHAVQKMADCVRAYTNEQYLALLRNCGFHEIGLHASLGGEDGPRQEGLFVLSARRG